MRFHNLCVVAAITLITSGTAAHAKDADDCYKRTGGNENFRVSIMEALGMHAGRGAMHLHDNGTRDDHYSVEEIEVMMKARLLRRPDLSMSLRSIDETDDDRFLLTLLDVDGIENELTLSAETGLPTDPKAAAKLGLEFGKTGDAAPAGGYTGEEIGALMSARLHMVEGGDRLRVIKVEAEGASTYEVEFSSLDGNFLHEVEINALTGRPRHFNADRHCGG